jgi:hypothetical protein
MSSFSRILMPFANFQPWRRSLRSSSAVEASASRPMKGSAAPLMRMVMTATIHGPEIPAAPTVIQRAAPCSRKKRGRKATMGRNSAANRMIQWRRANDVMRSHAIPRENRPTRSRLANCRECRLTKIWRPLPTRTGTEWQLPRLSPGMSAGEVGEAHNRCRPACWTAEAISWFGASVRGAKVNVPE